jgi:deazaflavin-dependent oxidoreductase (nitroreductase family)
VNTSKVSITKKRISLAFIQPPQIAPIFYIEELNSIVQSVIMEAHRKEKGMNTLRQVFKFLNRFFMIPAYRMGLGWFISNPVSGYIMVIKNKGRKSGKLYYTPTNYAIIKGKIYCLAGFGHKAHWYLNMKANPDVEVMLPGRTVWGKAEEVLESDEALQATRKVFQNAGIAGFAEGYNPWTAPDEKFLQTLERAPVLRISPTGIGNGPMDAGGWHWIAWAIATLVVILVIWL